jgi:hypothetical protein
VFQVVVLPPEGSTRDVEELRRLHDPAFHRIGAHVPLLPPFDSEASALVARFDAFRFAPFEIELGAPAVHGAALSLAVTRGDDDLRALRDALASRFLGPADERPSAAPSLRVGLLGGAADLELARRSLSTLPAPAAWRVDEIVLMVEDVRGLWHEVRRRRAE